MGLRRRFVLGVVVTLVATAAFRVALPELIRLTVVARVRAITGRAVSLDAVEIAVLRGHVALRGFRIADRAGEPEPFAKFDRLDLHLRLPALLRGHLWVREAVLRDPTVRVIRYPGDEFNLSDLVRQSGEAQRVLEVTIDRFELVNGTTTLEDRALPEPRTWRSEQITVEAHGLSSRPQYGTAVATSVTGGAPVSIRMTRLRLYPIDLEATLTIDGLDLAMGRVYLPPSTPVRLDRGRGSTSVRVRLDATDGLRLDATAHVEDIVLTRRDGGALARVPTLTATLDGLHFAPDGMALGRLALDASGAVVDPSTGSAARFAPTTVHAWVTDFTWPISQPAGLDLSTRVQGRGSLSLAGALHPPTAPTELRLRLQDFDLAPWARFTPFTAELSGVAEADLRIRGPLGAGLPSRVQGTIALKNAGVSDGSGRPLQAQRIEASGLALNWPDRLRIGRLAIREPRAVVERGRAGDFGIARLFGPPARPDSPAPVPGPAGAPPEPPALRVDVGEILVQDGTAEWRDRMVAPPVRASVSDLTATVTGAAWPIAGPLEVRLTGRPTGGGQVQIAGRVGLTPLAVDARVSARGVDLAPYGAYLQMPVGVRAWTDVDLAVALPAEGAPVSVRGRAALAKVEIRDGERTVFQVERAAATDLDVEWPKRVRVAHLDLQAPWILMERDKQGGMAIRALLPPAANGAINPAPAGTEKGPTAQPLAVTIGLVTVEEGGARVVDQSIAPQFALDLRRVTLRAEGVSTTRDSKTQVDLKGQAEKGTVLALRGTLGPVGGPLEFDLSGELRGFDAARANPYLVRALAWQAAGGSVAARLEGHVRDETLNARVDVQLSRLQVLRAAPSEGAGGVGAGLPLNVAVALLRDSRGDIRMSVPVGGRLSDPRFDFRETIRSAIRTVATNAIALPVSWIGRLRASPDSGIERVEVDPIRFQPGSAELTADGRTQTTRVAAFLGQMGEVRMGLVPVVSERDLAVLRRKAADAAVERLVGGGRVSPEAAAAQLFRERLPGRPVPSEPGATLAALADTEASPAHAPALAQRRLETLVAALKQAGVPQARLVESALVARPDSTEGVIELNLLEPDRPRRSQLLQTLRGLGGTTPSE